MLTAHQCETVAYTSDGAIICPDCARKAKGELSTARADAGLWSDLKPLIRYELDEYNGENASEYVANELGLSWENEDYDEAIEGYPNEHCSNCGTELS